MNEDGLEIEKVQEADIEELKTISIRTFLDAYAQTNSEVDLDNYMQKAFSPEQLISEIKNPDSYFYFLIRDNKVIGYLKLNVKTAQSYQVVDSSLEIERIYLISEEQGKRVGEKLLEFAIQNAKDRGLLSIWLAVWAENKKAIHFYRKHGFEVTQNKPFKLGNDLQCDFIMTRLVY